MLDLFKLEKLKIFAYSDRERTEDEHTFLAMFNPESYSLNYENVFDKKQGINTSGRSAKYSMSKPTKLSIKLIIDGTDVDTYKLSPFSSFKPTDVNVEIKKFLELTSYMDGKIHEPKFLRIEWGDLLFKCRLESVNVNYSLFKNSGIAIRAELDCVFVHDLDTTERLKLVNKRSPDLTHTRIVTAHDTLPIMCKRIYGSPLYHVAVAKANKINNLRDIKPGQEIFFPPIEK